MDTAEIEGLFNLVALAVAKRKPTVSGTMPSVADLEAELERIYTPASPEPQAQIESSQPGAIQSQAASSVATGCVPCSIGHLGTCSGLLNEAMRFARSEGVESEEVINRCNMCLDELNALERVDLRPELIHDLPDWEKALAEKALTLSRGLRHDLEGLSSVDGLEGITAKTQSTRQEIGTAWFKERLSRMTPEQRKMVEERLMQKTAEAKQQKEDRTNGTVDMQLR